MHAFPEKTSDRQDAAGRPPRRKPRRGWRRAGIAALVIVGLILLSTAVNLVLEQSEKSSTPAYGERVAVGGGALNVYRNGQQGQPVVLLSGLGTPAPALDFQPLIRELNGFDVIVVEGLGYGYSDLEGSPRTNENISNDLHEALAKLQVKQPYVLAGHSIAGFYMLDYANRYRAEVSAVVGIDASIPKPGNGPVPDPQPELNWQKALAVTGIVRVFSALVPGFVDPGGSAYTEDELQRMRMMTSWNYGAPAVADETARIGNNAQALKGVTYPDDLPVLAFIADEKTEHTAEKTAAAENLLQNVRRHEVVTLQGNHYLHWTQAPRMAETIRTFLAKG
ncbi:Alpha/beta hydrolase fold family protein [Arthrobacter sp. 9AX]|uniref:alpha/beta fold hydrolase n=1 Tax=Arthrobacter sp. 9AX TaxID=2653131 RepID=UPI0012F41402|nr:alpha/beta hydrolase [Arthrobacter sp. 9AX]VXB96548.1 Alpha/beta hydrolase fold family protein [Arthrobacter sp. 9AX]